MTATQRVKELGDILKAGVEVTIPEMAERFGVSEMTIRRDLDKLAKIGFVRRTHGGAVSTERMAFEFDFASKRQLNRSVKSRIAFKAAKIVEDGNRIILDTGTTTLELAHILKDRKSLTVITPSLAVASELQFSKGVQTILLGGAVRKGMPDLTGIVAEAVLEMFSADIAFQGADAIGFDGTLYTADMQVAAVDKKIRSRATRTYILADSSKLGRTDLVSHGSLNEVDCLITDDGISKKDRKHFSNFCSELIVVKRK